MEFQKKLNAPTLVVLGDVSLEVSSCFVLIKIHATSE